MSKLLLLSMSVTKISWVFIITMQKCEAIPDLEIDN